MRFAKLIITDKWGTRETPAYIFKEDDKTLSFANMNTGTFGQADRKDVDEKTLKGYTADAKKLIKEYVKAELKAKALEEQIRELRNPYRNIKEKLTKANGLLTPSEFLEELKKNGLEIDGRYYTDVSLCNNFLNIVFRTSCQSRPQNIQNPDKHYGWSIFHK